MKALVQNVNSEKSGREAELVDLKSRGHLIHANKHFFNLIYFTEKCFSEYSKNVDVLLSQSLIE